MALSLPANGKVSDTKMYLDGTLLTTLVGSSNAGTLINTGTGRNVNLGRCHMNSCTLNGAFFLQGELDEVEIFNRQLSSLEIQAIYQVGSLGKCK